MTDGQRRLAIFVPSMRGGGAERAMLKLATGIAARGYGVDLVLARAEGPYLADVPASVRLVDLAAPRVALSLGGLAGYLRRARPTAMLASWDYANIIALWARRLAGYPQRLIVNDQKSISHMARHASNWRGRIMPQIMRRFYPWADGVTAVSAGVAHDLAQAIGMPPADVRVIYNPVVTPELRAKAQQPLDHPWFQPGAPPVILGIGRLIVQKDFPNLIRAFAQVRQSHPARLMILGEGRDRPALEALVQQLGLGDVVGMPGFAENPYAYLARSRLFVLSSGWEGLPTVLIEALFCGAPVVATDCPSGPREILADGRFGRLVPVGDTAALAAAMAQALAEQAVRPPAASWQRFDQETVIDQYLELLVGSETCVGSPIGYRSS